MNTRQHLYRGFHPCDNGSHTITLDGKQIKGEWVEGDHITHIRAVKFNKKLGNAIDHYILTKEEVNSYTPPLYREKEYYVLPETVCEWTGLTDKNGVKIFEGDVVRILYTDWLSKDDNDKRTLEQYLHDISDIGFVVWNDETTGYMIKINNYFGSLVCGKYGYREVIGTIFSDAELLGGEE